MIDTVRVKIRLDDELTKLISSVCEHRSYFDKKGNAKQNIYGNLIFPFSKTAINFFFDSYNKNIIYLEGSYPKIWYGDNVHLLYEEQLKSVLKIIHRAFSKRFGEFPDYDIWDVQRLDTTYAWKFESEEKAMEVIEFAKGLELSRNSKHIYGNNESVTFGSKKSRTITFYRKYPEFQKKGFAELLKSGHANEAFDISELSKGVVRFEIQNKVEHLKSYFKTDKNISLDMFFDKTIIPSILNHHLKRLQGNIDLKLIHDKAIYKSLLSKYKANKAMRLFCFYKTYHSKLKTKNLIHKFGNSGDISNDLKDIKETSIILPTYLSQYNFNLSIPSTLVVNGPPSSEAVALELEKHLKLIDESIKYIKDDIVKELEPIKVGNKKDIELKMPF